MKAFKRKTVYTFALCDCPADKGSTYKVLTDWYPTPSLQDFFCHQFLHFSLSFSKIAKVWIELRNIFLSNKES